MLRLLSHPLRESTSIRPALTFVGLALAVAIVTTPLLAFAQQQLPGLPQMPLPTGAANNTDLLAQFWGWAKYLIGILAILIAAGAFLWIAVTAVGKFGDIVDNRGSLLSIIPTVGVGLLVLALVGVLLTLGWNIIQSATLTP